MKALGKISKYFEIGKISYLNNSAYFIGTISRGFTVFFRIWIFTALYRTTLNAYGLETINNLSLANVIWTLMIVQAFGSSTRPNIESLIQDEIKDGTFAYTINKPYSYFKFNLARSFGNIFSNILPNILIGSIAAMILVGPIQITFIGLMLGLILMLFGFILDFLISFIIGICAFWMEDITPLTWIHGKSTMVFGGMILPISLFPDKIQKIAELLPFSQLFYAPSKVITSGNFSDFIHYLPIQLIWISVAGLISYAVFKKGVRNVSQNGG